MNLAGKITLLENEISGLMTAIYTNSDSNDYIYNEQKINADLLNNAKNCINDFDSLTGEYCGEWEGATLKKMPLWGEQLSNDEINFEWPTPEIFAQMQPYVFLKSIEFKRYH